MTNSSQPGSSSSTGSTSSRVKLVVRGLGHVPALKNSFHAIVKPENREWKRRCVKLLESQLLCGSVTIESATQMPRSRRSSIALLPSDDCWQVIPEISIKSIKVQPGEEGADIQIEEL